MSMAASVAIRLVAGLAISVFIVKIWPRVLDSLERRNQTRHKGRTPGA